MASHKNQPPKLDASHSPPTSRGTDIADQWNTDLLREATEELIAKRRANQGITVPAPRPSDTQYDYDQEREHGWSVK